MEEQVTLEKYSEYILYPQAERQSFETRMYEEGADAESWLLSVDA